MTTGGQNTGGGGQGGAATTTGGFQTGTGSPSEMFTDQPAWAEAANPITATATTKPNCSFVFMHGSTTLRQEASKTSH